MKRIFATSLMAVFVVLIIAGKTKAQTKEQQKTTKTEKHIKMVKVDDKGKKMELDTVITGNRPFVWNGDTIGGGTDMMWISGEDFKMDSMQHFNYNINSNGNENVVIMKGDDFGRTMIMSPDAPMPPNAPGVMMFQRHQNKNVIDLSDPGIISYNKKIQKDGTEKITIVRKQVPEEDEMAPEDVLIGTPHGNNAFFYSNTPKHEKTVKVIKSDDGSIRVIENDEVIHIKEMKDGDEKKVEIEVEVDDEK